MPIRPPHHPGRIKARRLPPIRCAFCQEVVPKPRQRDDVFSPEGCKGGHCESCDAVYVLDETGKNGGSALLDGLVLACDGDLDRAMKLQAKVDYRVAAAQAPALRANPHNVESKIWFIELKRKPTSS